MAGESGRRRVGKLACYDQAGGEAFAARRLEDRGDRRRRAAVGQGRDVGHGDFSREEETPPAEPLNPVAMAEAAGAESVIRPVAQ